MSHLGVTPFGTQDPSTKLAVKPLHGPDAFSSWLTVLSSQPQSEYSSQRQMTGFSSSRLVVELRNLHGWEYG